VRSFARHWSAIDPQTEIPPQGLLPYRYQRCTPHLYTDDQIRRLIKAAWNLPPTTGLRRWTYSTLFGLLAVTGLRISEAIALQQDDVDLNQGLLTIRLTKFRKSRLVPLHPSTTHRLKRYASKRGAFYPKDITSHFFLSEQGRPLTDCMVRWTFVKLSRQIGLRGPSDRFGPRLHDFRHRFAVTTLLQWYRSGLDVEQRLPSLSTYLGHAHVTDTYWYLWAVPELLALSKDRLEKRWEV
jgi:integrase